MDIYFDLTNGDDTTGDGTSGNPYETLSKAYSVANNGDVLVLKDGIHILTAWVTTTINTTQVSIRSEWNNPTTCIINGGNTLYYRIIPKIANFELSISGIQWLDNDISSLGAQSILIWQISGNDYGLTVENCWFIHCVTSSPVIIGFAAANHYDGHELRVRRCLFKNISTTSAFGIIGARFGRSN